jgi:putative hydrolase of the HAD superfamily
MPIVHPIEAITLDLDDTLWPVLPTLVAAEAALAQWLREQAPATATAFTPQLRQSLRRQLLAERPERAHDMGWLRRELLRRALVQTGDPAELAEPAFEVFLAARQRVSLYPDVMPVLQAWSRRYRLVAVTNGNADIAAIGLAPYFAGCISAHDIGCAKPDPRMFHAACRMAGTDPAATLHVGDDWQLDVRAARVAGLQSAWLRRPDLKHETPPDAGEHDAPPAFESLHAMDAHLHQDSPR